MSDLTLKRKWGFLAAYILYFVLGYNLIARFSFFDPVVFPLLLVDQKIPLMSWTVWAYISEYAFFFVAVALIDDKDQLKKMALSFFLTFTFCFVIFIFYPVTLPRPFISVHTLSDRALRTLWTIDEPVNCFPSLHVALAFITSFAFWRVNHRAFLFLTLWSTVIALSTMTTKQHYFVDVLAGFVLAAVVVPFSAWCASKMEGEISFRRLGTIFFASDE